MFGRLYFGVVSLRIWLNRRTSGGDKASGSNELRETATWT